MDMKLGGGGMGRVYFLEGVCWHQIPGVGLFIGYLNNVHESL